VKYAPLHGAALVVADFCYHQNSASGGAKTPFLDPKCLCFQSHLLSFKDIEHWRPPKMHHGKLYISHTKLKNF